MNLLFGLVLVNSIFLLNALPLKISDKPMEGDLFEGDIAGVKLMNSTDSRGYAQLDNYYSGIWTGGIVPYKIEDYTYTQAQQNVILEGMRLIESQTSINGRQCIKFQPRTNQANYIRIFSGNGCYSSVGRQKFGSQDLSLRNPDCLYRGIVAHELIHALGFWHEQSRSDRDNYLNIIWYNILPGQEHNFQKYDASQATTLGFGYDYNSIMHYESTAFSANGGPTMLPKQPGVTLLPAYQKNLSPTDIAEIRKYYNCN